MKREQLKELEDILTQAYEGETTMQEAERLAARFLVAQMQISGALRTADLDSRMKKTGVKALRAALYLNIVGQADKKPTEAAIAAQIDTDAMVEKEQNSLDAAEAESYDLRRYYDIFENAHVYFRGIAKGNFGG
jgi:hypothetical protein